MVEPSVSSGLLHPLFLPVSYGGLRCCSLLWKVTMDMLLWRRGSKLWILALAVQLSSFSWCFQDSQEVHSSSGNVQFLKEGFSVGIPHSIWRVLQLPLYQSYYSGTLRHDYCTQNCEAVYITLDSCYDLDTWWEITCHQALSNYDVILDHAHILFLSEEKNCCWKDCKTRSSSR